MRSDSRFALLVLKPDINPNMTKLFTSACKSLLVLFVLAFSYTSQAQDIPTEPAAISAGESLFNANCKACHRVNQKLVGPALAGVYDRAPSIDWIKKFIKNSSAVIASGDDYAVKLYNEYNKTQMTAFSSLKDEDIMNILAYVKAEEGKAQTAATPGPAQPDGGGAAAGTGVSEKYLNIIMIGMVIILALLFTILAFLVSALKRFLGEKELSEEDREVVHAPAAGSIFKSKGFIFIVVFLVTALAFKAVIGALFSIGVQKDYAPVQPIAFSHKVHAGQYEIDCKYCHTGVMKGKSATIPSVNVCWNCHNQIREGTNTGGGEIAKIVKAYETNTPIEWVRIHNLPDLAYFNHAQHVNVGGQECQTCHGPVETMDVVKQHSLLTMGWCIDCHRKTDVNSKGNQYYDNLVELHTKSKKGNMKVEDIGGLECSKCHY
jgi:mono/diheme cytochrome c family protein